jgi:23S rRNA (cytosine1962-C5)-methyltransferase
MLEGLPDAAPGDLGEICTSDGEPVGVATVNPSSQIIARVLRWTMDPVDVRWLQGTLAKALTLRNEMVDRDRYDAFRCIHGEADGLSGLVVDLYGSYAVVQSLSLFWHRCLEKLTGALGELLSPKGILLKTRGVVKDPQVPEELRTVQGEDPPARLEVREGAARLLVDLKSGQKTGLYLDQRLNRVRLGQLGENRDVLVVFAYTGAFGVHAGLAGARRVVLVESSAKALALAEENWRHNGLEDASLECIRENAWDYLRREARSFELVLVDPPALAKAARHVQKASRGYRDINLHAMKRLAPEGWLATFSCSQHIPADLFQKIVFGASVDAELQLVCAERLGASPDHPVLLDHPQGEYLKGMLLRSLAASSSRDCRLDNSEDGDDR